MKNYKLALFLTGFLALSNVDAGLCAEIQSVDDDVLAEVFANYTPESRPLFELNGTIPVQVEFSLINVIELDSKSQSLAMTIAVNAFWTDPRLAWDPDNRPEYLVVPKGKIWTPNILLGNALNNLLLDDEMILQPVIRYNGLVLFSFAGIIKSRCPMDLRKFPMDTQVCQLFFYDGSAFFTQVKMATGNSVSMDLSNEQGDWMVDSVGVGSSPRFVQGALIETLELQVTLSRQPIFHIVSSIIPLVSLSLLNPVVFLLPLEHGERISFSVSLLLSYTVTLSSLSDVLPSTTNRVSYISSMACVCMFISVNIALLVILIARIVTWKTEPTRTLFWACLGRCVCWKRSNRVLSAYSVTSETSYLGTSEKETSENQSLQEKVKDQVFYVRDKKEELQAEVKTTPNLDAKNAVVKENIVQDTGTLQWCDIACILNRASFLLTAITTIVTLTLHVALMAM